MDVSLDRASCQGDCVCELICPDVFALDAEGIAFLRSAGETVPEGSAEHWVQIDADFKSKVTEAATECPMHCIQVRGG